MAKGDTITIDKAFTVTASQAGRTVDLEWEKDGGINWAVVRERTRGGTLVREVKVAATSIISIEVSKKEVE